MGWSTSTPSLTNSRQHSIAKAQSHKVINKVTVIFQYLYFYRLEKIQIYLFGTFLNELIPFLNPKR
jgi:hypothetical protein